MSGSLRILTYNAQCRSWGMEAGAQGTLDPTTSADTRAAEISKRILNSYRTWDVVCLNEVFDEDAREVFISELGHEFPHQVRKCDVDELALQLGIVGGAAALLTVPGIGWLAGLGIATAGLTALAQLRYEDSGLMLFSRLPFAQIPTPGAIAGLPPTVGVIGPTIPDIAFVPYVKATGWDKYSAKGVLYAAINRGGGRRVHVLASHTQADDADKPGQHSAIRVDQFAQVEGLIRDQVASIDRSEIVFCGDLNIDGTQRAGGGGAEWTSTFGPAGGFFHHALVDSWHREQCPGDPAFGGTVLPSWFDRGPTCGDQRLDYLVRTAPPFPDRLVAQHIAIPYEVAQNPDPIAPKIYTSDHLPLSIDLHDDHSRATVRTAELITFPDPPIYPPVDTEISNGLEDGQMHWYRIDQRGSYGIRLTDGEDRVRLEVYTADNLSVPHAPFRLLTDQHGEGPPWQRFALPSAPFYLRVFLLDRQHGSRYTLEIHRYLGRGPEDAIPLLRGVTETFTPRVGQPHSLDDSGTPGWSEHDAVWFVAPLDTRPDGSLTATSTVSVTGEHDAFGLLVLDQHPGSPRGFITEEPAGQDPVVATFSYDKPATGYFLVKRHAGTTFPAHRFKIRLDSDVTYLYSSPAVVPGQPPRATRATRLAELVCVDESDGVGGNEWGSDDIQVNVHSNGELLVHIPHSPDLDFDDDAHRNLPQLDGVRYIGGADFELVELDDTSVADRAKVHLPPYAAVAADPSLIFAEGNGSTLTAKFRLVFDSEDSDGIYDLIVDVSQEPPPQIP